VCLHISCPAWLVCALTQHSSRIPLERGRDLAMQFGVEPLIAPLFDFQPNPNMFGPSTLFSSGLTVPSRPLSASSLSGLTGQSNSINGSLAPPPIMPGSALRLLNQGRAQGLFTPSTTTLALLAAGAPGSTHSPATPLLPSHHIDPALMGETGSLAPSVQQPLKRTLSQRDDLMDGISSTFPSLAAPADIRMSDSFRAASVLKPSGHPLRLVPLCWRKRMPLHNVLGRQHRCRNRPVARAT
jgi:hypothetical protein